MRRVVNCNMNSCWGRIRRWKLEFYSCSKRRGQFWSKRVNSLKRWMHKSNWWWKIKSLYGRISNWSIWSIGCRRKRTSWQSRRLRSTMSCTGIYWWLKSSMRSIKSRLKRKLNSYSWWKSNWLRRSKKRVLSTVNWRKRKKIWKRKCRNLRKRLKRLHLKKIGGKKKLSSKGGSEIKSKKNIMK